MEINILDTKGKKLEKITLDKDVFGVEPNMSILAQYVRVFRTNQRQGTSKVKDRSEVSGGGKKPWNQKGSGRARQGSTRSPLWVGGGVVHGPQPKTWLLKLPKKMKQAAMRSALSLTVKKDNLKIIDKIDFKKPSTKEMTEILKNIKAGGRVLLVTPSKDDNILKSAGNIKKLKVSLYENLSAYDVLKAHNVVFVQEALEKVTKKYKK